MLFAIEHRADGEAVAHVVQPGPAASVSATCSGAENIAQYPSPPRVGPVWTTLGQDGLTARLLVGRGGCERHSCRDACFTHRKRASAEGRLRARSSGGRTSFAV